MPGNSPHPEAEEKTSELCGQGPRCRPWAPGGFPALRSAGHVQGPLPRDVEWDPTVPSNPASLAKQGHLYQKWKSTNQSKQDPGFAEMQPINQQGPIV